MQRYKLYTLPIFENDLIEILDYIAFTLENPTASDQLLNEIKDAVDKRLSAPSAFEKYYPKGLNEPHYRIRVKNYLIFYVVADDVMELRRIVYNKRDVENLI